MHIDTFFFRWYDDVLHIAVDADQGTRLDIIKSSILDKVLDGGSGRRVLLYFVEYNDRLMRILFI